ncbi:hypothetical protein HDU67_003561 [Dinochytrium kinnereticum]|nr:hypothetical protein HDU67_003561 [Dinochytrium kinnereticum]
MPSYSEKIERTVMLVDPKSMKDVATIFAQLHDLLPVDMMSLMMAGDGLLAEEGVVVKSLGEITKAAVNGSPLLIIFPPHSSRSTDQYDYIHFSDILAIADETSLRRPGHFIIQSRKGGTSLHFIAGSSVVYTRWMSAILSCLKRGTEARKNGFDRIFANKRKGLDASKDLAGTAAGELQGSLGLYNVQGVSKDVSSGRWVVSSFGLKKEPPVETVPYYPDNAIPPPPTTTTTNSLRIKTNPSPLHNYAIYNLPPPPPPPIPGDTQSHSSPPPIPYYLPYNVDHRGPPMPAHATPPFPADQAQPKDDASRRMSELTITASTPTTRTPVGGHRYYFPAAVGLDPSGVAGEGGQMFTPSVVVRDVSEVDRVGVVGGLGGSVPVVPLPGMAKGASERLQDVSEEPVKMLETPREDHTSHDVEGKRLEGYEEIPVSAVTMPVIAKADGLTIAGVGKEIIPTISVVTDKVRVEEIQTNIQAPTPPVATEKVGEEQVRSKDPISTITLPPVANIVEPNSGKFHVEHFHHEDMMIPAASANDKKMTTTRTDVEIQTLPIPLLPKSLPVNVDVINTPIVTNPTVLAYNKVDGAHADMDVKPVDALVDRTRRDLGVAEGVVKIGRFEGDKLEGGQQGEVDGGQRTESAHDARKDYELVNVVESNQPTTALDVPSITKELTLQGNITAPIRDLTINNPNDLKPLPTPTFYSNPHPPRSPTLFTSPPPKQPPTSDPLQKLTIWITRLRQPKTPHPSPPSSPRQSEDTRLSPLLSPPESPRRSLSSVPIFGGQAGKRFGRWGAWRETSGGEIGAIGRGSVEREVGDVSGGVVGEMVKVEERAALMGDKAIREMEKVEEGVPFVEDEAFEEVEVRDVAFKAVEFSEDEVVEKSDVSYDVSGFKPNDAKVFKEDEDRHANLVAESIDVKSADNVDFKKEVSVTDVNDAETLKGCQVTRRGFESSEVEMVKIPDTLPTELKEAETLKILDPLPSEVNEVQAATEVNDYTPDNDILADSKAETKPLPNPNNSKNHLPALDPTKAPEKTPETADPVEQTPDSPFTPSVRSTTTTTPNVEDPSYTTTTLTPPTSLWPKFYLPSTNPSHPPPSPRKKQISRTAVSPRLPPGKIETSPKPPPRMSTSLMSAGTGEGALTAEPSSSGGEAVVGRDDEEDEGAKPLPAIPVHHFPPADSKPPAVEAVRKPVDVVPAQRGFAFSTLFMGLSREEMGEVSNERRNEVVGSGGGGDTMFSRPTARNPFARLKMVLGRGGVDVGGER